jgi:hypothetical protein
VRKLAAGGAFNAKLAAQTGNQPRPSGLKMVGYQKDDPAII